MNSPGARVEYSITGKMRRRPLTINPTKQKFDPAKAIISSAAIEAGNQCDDRDHDDEHPQPAKRIVYRASNKSGRTTQDSTEMTTKQQDQPPPTDILHSCAAVMYWALLSSA